MQYVDIKDALKHTGIKLTKPEKFRREVINCHGCGRFMGGYEIYNGSCKHCGCDNRP